MDPKIKRLKSTTFNGRRFTRRQLSDMQRTVANFPKLSRQELAQTICENLEWRTPGGNNSYQACLGVLRQLEQLGVLRLPPKDERQQRGARKPLAWSERGQPQPLLEAELSALMPLRLEEVSAAEDQQLWKEWVDRYHYLGYRHPVGPHLRYFIVDGQGRRLGCMGFCYATKTLPCRDAWIGWQQQKHKQHLHLALNQNRFLILPWVKVKNLASKFLSMACRQLADDWQRRHGYRPVLIETFVDESRFQASCYRAANWSYLGTTEKRSGKTRKGVYVYALEPQAKTILRQGPNAPRPPSKPAKASSAQLAADETFVQLWRNLIDAFIEVASEFDSQWRQRRRVIDSLLVMLFVFRLVLSHNGSGYATVLSEFWQQCQQLGIDLPQDRPVAASAMCNARKKVDERVFKQLQRRILQLCRAQCDAFRWQGRRLYAVDGSKLQLPRPLCDYGYRTPNDKAHYPQGLVSCLYQLHSRIPIDFELAAHGNERKLALQHLQGLQPTDVVVYDRGYYSYEMLYEHRRRGVDAIFRMQRNSAKVIDQFMQSEAREAIVQVPARPEIRCRIQARRPQAKCPPLSLRLVKYTIEEEEYTLATTLEDRQQFTCARLSAVYHDRWGIEELYKISKQTMTVEQFHAHSERGVKQELYAHFVLITWTRLFSNHAEQKIQSPSAALLAAEFQTRADGVRRWSGRIAAAAATLETHRRQVLEVHE